MECLGQAVGRGRSSTPMATVIAQRFLVRLGGVSLARNKNSETCL